MLMSGRVGLAGRRATKIAAKMVVRVGLSAEAAEARTLFDCHICPGCCREARLGLSESRENRGSHARDPPPALHRAMDDGA